MGLTLRETPDEKKAIGRDGKKISLPYGKIFTFRRIFIGRKRSVQCLFLRPRTPSDVITLRRTPEPIARFHTNKSFTPPQYNNNF